MSERAKLPWKVVSRRLGLTYSIQSSHATEESAVSKARSARAAYDRTSGLSMVELGVLAPDGTYTKVDRG